MVALNYNGDFERLPRVVRRYSVIDKDGNPMPGTFLGPLEMCRYLNRVAANQQQDSERTGAGWDVAAVRS